MKILSLEAIKTWTAGGAKEIELQFIEVLNVPSGPLGHGRRWIAGLSLSFFSSTTIKDFESLNPQKKYSQEPLFFVLMVNKHQTISFFFQTNFFQTQNEKKNNFCSDERAASLHVGRGLNTLSACRVS